MAKFKDIPQFTRQGSYSVNVSWDYLEEHLKLLADRGNKDFGGLDMNPDFQREYVWTDKQRIRYVEYILRGGCGGKDIYWNCGTWMTTYKDPIVLVDGKQRIDAVLKFLHDEIPAFGHLYSEYEDKIDMLTCYFVFNVNNLKTRKEILQWYVDLNSGGTVHTDEEIEKVKRMIMEEDREKNAEDLWHWKCKCGKSDFIVNEKCEICGEKFKKEWGENFRRKRR